MRKNKVIKICWILPLTFGILIFLSWILTKFDFLMIAGIYDIYLGIVLTIIGLLIAIIQIVGNKRNSNKSDTRKVIILIILMFTNFPIGFGILYCALTIQTAFTTKIQNHTNKTIFNCEIIGGGVEEKIGQIKPNEEITKTVWIKQDGALNFKYLIDKTEKVVNIEGYVTNSMGGNESIEIKE